MTRSTPAWRASSSGRARYASATPSGVSMSTVELRMAMGASSGIDARERRHPRVACYLAHLARHLGELDTRDEILRLVRAE